MSDLSPAERLAEVEAQYAALLLEHEKFKHLAAIPQLEMKLAIFNRFPMPIWACDRDCHIVFWNEGAARLYGYSADEAIGKDFVNLFVNPPEREKARIDCIDIIDNDRPIKNMADDVDKHGNTRKLVTHCFPIYNVELHSGLQVEISYEVQDHDRLKMELDELQLAARRKQEQIEELERKLVEETRKRALSALQARCEAAKEDHKRRLAAADTADLSKDADKTSIAKVRAEIKTARKKLLEWERDKRKLVLSNVSADDLEGLITELESGDDFDV